MKMIGIIDEFGIDNLVQLEGNYKQAFILFIRSKFQKSAVFFCLDFTEKEVNMINHLVSSHEVELYNKAGIMIVEKINSLNKGSAKTEKLSRKFYELGKRFKRRK